MPGHKALFGPQGTGCMLVTGKMSLASLIEGGTGSLSSDDIQPEFMPDHFESGTLNVHGIAGLLEGVRFIRYGKWIAGFKIPVDCEEKLEILSDRGFI